MKSLEWIPFILGSIVGCYIAFEFHSCQLQKMERRIEKLEQKP